MCLTWAMITTILFDADPRHQTLVPDEPHEWDSGTIRLIHQEPCDFPEGEGFVTFDIVADYPTNEGYPTDDLVVEVVYPFSRPERSFSDLQRYAFPLSRLARGEESLLDALG